MADPKIQRYSYQWFIDQFVEAKDRSIDFCEPLSHDIFVRRPAEDSWCVGECYSHLNTFGHKYMEQIYKGIDQASREREPKSAQESYPQDYSGKE
ncbi:MAG: hypothetical protein U5K69_01825 [Balneolaceae bacterium]|nr:hypothetical protein [Balneolaceae bacterium]